MNESIEQKRQAARERATTISAANNTTLTYLFAFRWPFAPLAVLFCTRSSMRSYYVVVEAGTIGNKFE